MCYCTGEQADDNADVVLLDSYGSLTVCPSIYNTTERLPVRD